MSASISKGRRSWSARSRVLLIAALLVVAPVVAVTYTQAPLASPAAAAVGDPVLAVGGDIACRPGRVSTTTTCQYSKTATLVQSMNPTTVLPLGDTQYDTGATTEYQQSYNPTWGAFKSVSRPAVGNHEYMTTGAAGYYGYFGSLAGDPAKGYYSYNVDGPGFQWHVISLNTECAEVGGCGVGSAQEIWLKNDLAANKNVCTLAYSHRPRFSSGSVIGSASAQTPFFQDLYNAGADLFLSGHAHHYERFAPQTASGAADSAKGVTQFVVGTAGDDFQGLQATPVANSVVRQNTNFGVLKLTLHANTYDYAFVPSAGYTFTDSGSGTCHNAPASDTTPPSTPTGLAATAPTPNQVNLSWTASTDNVGVKGYNIYRGANGAPPTLLTTTITNATTFTDSSVSASTSYGYQVQAFDAAGKQSGLSVNASVTTPATADTSLPTAPGNLLAELITSNEVDLGWDASSDTGTGVSGYRVYRAVTGTTTYTLLGTTNGTVTRFQDTTAVQNTRYSYNVTAFDGAGNISPPSQTVTAATPPGPTTATYAFTTAGDAMIDQTNATTNYGADTRLVMDNSPVNDSLLKFNVSAPACDSITGATLRLVNADSSNKGGDFYTTGAGWDESQVNWNSAPARGTFLNSLGAVASGNTYSVDVTNGVTVTNGEIDFRIANTSSDGARYYSKEGAGTTAARRPQLTLVCANNSTDTLAPTAPSSLTATAVNSGQVNLSWTASTDNVAVTGYNIFGGTGTTPIATVTGGALSWSDITVAPNTAYSYTVTAFDAANNESPKSNSASVTTPASSSAPLAPTGLGGSSPNSSEVDLAWTASATPDVSYNVYRAPATGSFTKIGSAGAGLTTYNDIGIATPGSYRYQVTALNAASGESPASNTLTIATAGSTAPAPPTNLNASGVSTSEIDVTWTASTTPSVTSYKIYKDGGATAVGTVPATASPLVYKDTALTAGSTHSYTVTAVDPNGESTKPTAVSGTTSPSDGGGIGVRSTAAITRTTTAATSWTVSLPTYSAGDLMVIWLGNNLGSTAGTPASSGWTSQQMVNESSGLKGTFLTRRMATGDPASINVTWGGSTLGVAEAVAFTGVNTTTPVEVKGGLAEASTTAVTSHSTPSLTTTTANDVLVSGFTTDNASTWTSTGTELADAAAGSVSASLYYSAPVTAGSNTRSATATIGSVKAVSGLLALRP